MNRDFYSALHTLNRGKYFKVDKKYLEKLKTFTEGVIHLMKRKFQEGVTNLTEVLTKFTIGDFLKVMVLGYRAYGNFCLGNHRTSLEDYNQLEKIVPLGEASSYNKLIA